MSQSLTTTLYISLFNTVERALLSPNFDEEETLFQIITHSLGGNEPSFYLYEQVSMAFNLA